MRLDCATISIQESVSVIAQLREVVSQKDANVAEIERQLRCHETLRRKLHNQVQELKVGGMFRLYLVD